MNLKKVAVLVGAVLATSAVSDYILKNGPDDPTGFVEITPGLGMDEVALALVTALFYFGGGKLIGGGS